MKYEEEIHSFLEKENSKNKLRNYLHFDKAISIKKSYDSVKEYLLDNAQISSHKFFPFIKYEVAKEVFGDELGERRIINKIHRKTRPICFAAHFDAIIYAYYAFLLNKKYEAFLENQAFEECVSAYRKIERNGEKYCNIHIARDAFLEVKKRENCFVLVTDISKFFDSLCHKKLKQKWADILGEPLPKHHYKVFKSLTDFSFIEKSEIDEVMKQLNLDKKAKLEQMKTRRYCSAELYRKHFVSGKKVKKSKEEKTKKCLKRGIPQGTPISALLSNIYMKDFDATVFEEVAKMGGFYRRYSDDILIVVSSKEQLEAVKNILHSALETVYLEMKDEKTDEYEFKKEGEKVSCWNVKTGKPTRLQYLGFNYDGQTIWIRETSISKLYISMTKAVRQAVAMAHGKKGKKNGLVFKKNLYNRFTTKRKIETKRKNDKKERGNFITYARKAARIMESPAILKQLRNMPKNIKQSIEKESMKRLLLNARRKMRKEKTKAKLTSHPAPSE